MPNRMIAAVLIPTSLLAAPALHAQPLSEVETARVEAVMQDIGAPEDPGVAVGIVRDGAVVFERYVGLADLSNGIPLGPDSRTNIASNAKQYVALMVLDLADQGRISMDEDFRTYLPGALPEIEEAITVTNLITHTSGVRDIYDLWSLTGITWYLQRQRNREAMELLNRQRELNFAPGSDYLYSNSNYILLAEMIAKVTGERFDTYARWFFDRVGMEETGWKRVYSEVVPDLARAYGNWNGWREDPAIANLYGDGFLFTTLSDQLAWEAQVQGADSALSADLVARSQTRPDAELPGEYGFGLELGIYRGVPAIEHIGSTGGYNAYLQRFPGQDVSVVLIGNTTEIGVVALGRALSDTLLEGSFGESQSYPTEPDKLLDRPANSDITGRFLTDTGTIIRIVERDGELYREIDGCDPAKLVHERGNLFEYETVPGLKMAFDRTDDGERRFRIYYPGQAVSAGLPYPEPSDDPVAKRALEGRYVNAETDTEIVIDWKDGTAFTMTKNGRARDAELVTTDVLAWNNYRFRFQRDASGAVDTLLVDNNRIRNVRFERAD
ncbi:serine hydrolase domain-containing protein [Erythrobacter sp. GH1-10]|uniref:serine hydrolase domain-containing protein n=1 Tax=Erythrobacter sp. GH1-10 TaxID=3349334 RepID=UPI003877F2D1